MKKAILRLLVLIVLFSSCNNQNQNEARLNDECLRMLSEIIFPIMCEDGDSIRSIYEIQKKLFTKHYTQHENDRFIKFGAEILDLKTNKTDTLFFGIDKKHSELVLFNFLKEYDVLTLDFHIKIGEDLRRFNKMNCFSSKVNSSNYSEQPIYYQNKTFDLSKDNYWTIDSIQGKNTTKSIFQGIKEFSVVDNAFIVTASDSIPFQFKDYTLKISSRKHWIISSSQSHKILFDDNENYIFISKKHHIK